MYLKMNKRHTNQTISKSNRNDFKVLTKMVELYYTILIFKRHRKIFDIYTWRIY